MQINGPSEVCPGISYTFQGSVAPNVCSGYHWTWAVYKNGVEIHREPSNNEFSYIFEE